MFCDEILDLAQQVIILLKKQGKTIVTAESCTGGLLSAALTEISGASDVVFGGYATYANEAKNQMLGVPVAMIKEYGAVSEQVAIAMAKGALEASGADIAISITGIAGPSGGTKKKPVGLVHFAYATKQNTYHLEMFFDKKMPRKNIREASVKIALEVIEASSKV